MPLYEQTCVPIPRLRRRGIMPLPRYLHPVRPGANTAAAPRAVHGPDLRQLQKEAQRDQRVAQKAADNQQGVHDRTVANTCGLCALVGGAKAVLHMHAYAHAHSITPPYVDALFQFLFTIDPVLTISHVSVA